MKYKVKAILPYVHIVHLIANLFDLFHIIIIIIIIMGVEGKITEVTLDEKVTGFRAQLSPGMFLEPSFPTIAGVNGNGAIVHYR